MKQQYVSSAWTDLETVQILIQKKIGLISAKTRNKCLNLS